MLSYINSINLIRYLLVWRVNSSLVALPEYLSPELSPILGSIITNRLPTSDARYWRKALAPWDEYYSNENNVKASEVMQEAVWPIEAILLAYPGKRTYGKNELIIWELKLFGESADHGFFLEVILPAMEEAGYTSEPKWNRPNKIWGRFDINSVYVARGSNWEPLVTDGRLDLRYRASPTQWSEGLIFESDPGQEISLHKFNKPTRLNWLTPFNLDEKKSDLDPEVKQKQNKTKKNKPGPEIAHILESLNSRMKILLPRMEGELLTQEVLDQANSVSMIHKKIKLANKDWPGFHTGTQLFSHIPFSLIPYLELASILHIGENTHFGCGTYVLIRSTKGE